MSHRSKNLFLQPAEERTEDDGEFINFTPERWWHRLWPRKQSSKPKAAEKFGWIQGVLVSNFVIVLFAVCDKWCSRFAVC